MAWLIVLESYRMDYCILPGKRPLLDKRPGADFCQTNEAPQVEFLQPRMASAQVSQQAMHVKRRQDHSRAAVCSYTKAWPTIISIAHFNFLATKSLLVTVL